MKFITYYYDKNPNESCFYKNCYLNLKNQIEKFNYFIDGENIDFSKMHIQAYDKLNLYKPTFILNKLEKYNEPVIWIDADASVIEKPIEFEKLNCDIGFCIREHDMKTPHAAVIYFSNTEKSKEFLRDWETRCKEKMFVEWNCTEHCILVDLFNTIDNNINITKLYNFASINQNTKIKIGISPAGWEYEQSKFTTKDIKTC
jgi:hypothetical protein